MSGFERLRYLTTVCSASMLSSGTLKLKSITFMLNTCMASLGGSAGMFTGQYSRMGGKHAAKPASGITAPRHWKMIQKTRKNMLASMKKGKTSPEHEMKGCAAASKQPL